LGATRAWRPAIARRIAAARLRHFRRSCGEALMLVLVVR
jgi:hypothetical protein